MSEPRSAYGGTQSETTSRDNLISEALAPAYNAVSADTTRIAHAVDWLITEARDHLDPAILAAAALAIDELPILAARLDAGENGPAAAALVENVYLLRGLLADPEGALQLLATRAYLQSIDIPESLPDLRLDLAVASEQLSFAALVQAPGRMPAIMAAVQHFRRQYAKAYLRHHEMYWQTMANVQSHLLDADPRAAALARLNSLAELGPPVGEMALESITALADESAGCNVSDLAEALADSPVCPSCNVRLDQHPPLAQAEDSLARLDRAIERQLARLSSVAVRETLERSADPRVDRFLRVVQAAQLSSLAEVLDDALTNYLRRFLLEARINAVLDPLLSQVERGEQPDESTAREKLAEVSDLIKRAQQSWRRTLPAPQEKE